MYILIAIVLGVISMVGGILALTHPKLSVSIIATGFVSLTSSILLIGRLDSHDRGCHWQWINHGNLFLRTE